MRKSLFNDYPSTQINLVIDEWCHNEKYRKVLKACIIDGKTYREVANDFYMSEQGIVKIIDTYGNVLLSKLEKESG